MRKIIAVLVIASFFLLPNLADAGCCGNKHLLKKMTKPPIKEKLQKALKAICPCKDGKPCKS